MRRGPAQVGLTFADVSVRFSREEWGLLSAWQRDLYREVTADNYASLVFLGLITAKPRLLSRLQRGRQWHEEEPGGPASRPSLARNGCRPSPSPEPEDPSPERRQESPRGSISPQPRHHPEPSECPLKQKSGYRCHLGVGGGGLSRETPTQERGL
uniref:Uncharacterized protein n=1 Tax=Sphaerodactylus townsendi TaxID=933632 RepID=A0ACB8FXU2_9SAUR